MISVSWRARLPFGLLVLLWVGASPARAEPAFAVRTGYRCSQCHLNRSGGGMRTDFGSLYSQTILPARLLAWREESNLLPANPDARFAIGADLRLQYLNVQSDDVEDISSFEIPEANVYGTFHPVPGRFSIYLDQTVGPGGASARELFGLYQFRRLRGYVKAGRFLPPYGWRLPDDAAFIRQFTGFTYSAPDTGVEVGFEPGRWSAHLAVTNGGGGGGDDNEEKKITASAVYRFKSARVGLSASNEIDAGTSRRAGLYAGLNVGRVALLIEGDWLEREEGEANREGLVALLETNLLIARGVNVKLAHDWLDPDRDLDTDEQTRDSLGLEVIPYPFVQLRWFVRVKDGPPQILGANDTQIDFEVHLHF